MSKRVLVPLRHRYPTMSRMTRWRLKNQPGFPAGVDINGTEYHYADELDAFEETRRRGREQSSGSVSAAKGEAQ